MPRFLECNPLPGLESGVGRSGDPVARGDEPQRSGAAAEGSGGDADGGAIAMKVLVLYSLAPEERDWTVAM